MIAFTVWQVLGQWWVGLVAFGVALVATPVARYIAYRTRIVDRPDDLLKPHGRPIAYMGGLAMCAGLLVGLGAYLAKMPGLRQNWDRLVECASAMRILELAENPIWSMTSIAIACLMVTIMGLLDDIRSLKPRQKIYWQVASALVLVAGGVGNKMAMLILGQIAPEAYWPVWVVLPVSSLMCIVLVIATCNSTNLLDGLDGLCGGVTEIIALGFLALAVLLACYGDAPRQGDPQLTQEYDALRVTLCLAMAGAILGFLPYNVPPASIFMGDAGSMLLGLFVATMMAMFCREMTARWLLAAIMVYSLPIADTGLAVVRRFIAGKSIFAGDRSHLYDQLVDRGMTVKKVVVLFYLLAALAAFLGVFLTTVLRGREALVIYAALAAIVWIIFWRTGMIKPPPHDAGRKIHE